MSRNAQRRRISVSMPSPASNDFACFADLTALSVTAERSTPTISPTGCTFRWLKRVGGAGFLSKKKYNVDSKSNQAAVDAVEALSAALFVDVASGTRFLSAYRPSDCCRRHRPDRKHPVRTF